MIKMHILLLGRLFFAIVVEKMAATMDFGE